MSQVIKAFFVAVLAVSFFAATPAQAQSKKDLAAQNAALAERLARLESRMLTGDPAAERLMSRIDSLETAQRTLRGELERVAYERDGLKGEVMQLRFCPTVPTNSHSRKFSLVLKSSVLMVGSRCSAHLYRTVL